MPLEYFIEELKNGSKIQRGSSFSLDEAKRTAARIAYETKNPVSINPIWIESNQIDEPEIKQFTAQELYEEVRGKDAKLDDQPYRTKLLYRLLSEKANSFLNEYRSEVIEGGEVIEDSSVEIGSLS